MSGAHVRILLDLDQSIHPVGGRITGGGAPEREFAGWMQLAEALDAALTAGRKDRPDGGVSPPSSDVPPAPDGTLTPLAAPTPGNRSSR